MRKIIKFLSSLLIFLFEIFLVIVFIVEVAVSSLIMQTIEPWVNTTMWSNLIEIVIYLLLFVSVTIASGVIAAYINWQFFKSEHFIAKIVNVSLAGALYASFYLYLYFTCEIYMSDTLYSGVFTVFIAPYQIAGLVVLIVIYVSLYFYKRRKLKDNDQRNQANIRSC